MAIDLRTDPPGSARQVIRVGPHTTFADMARESGGTASAPGAHDFFDAALAVCKAHTAFAYARLKALPLEGVEVQVERDDSRERQGTYLLKVKVAFVGPLAPEQRERLYEIVGRCPVHRLMTTSEVIIETAPLA